MNNEKDITALEEFFGDPSRCVVNDTELDVSTCDITENNCLTNAANIAQKYPFCLIVEGILVSKNKQNEDINCVQHVWNYDTRKKIYFDFTIKADEKHHDIQHETMEYTYFSCCQYDINEVKRENRNTFKYSYDFLLEHFRSSIQIKIFRPRWTCGRYNAEKHVAIMYNLLAGYSFFFESFSADVIGHILAAGRDGIVSVNVIAEATGIAIESIQPFFKQLLDLGLLTDRIYNKEEIDSLRMQLAKTKKSQQSWIDKSVEEKLPMDTSSAEYTVQQQMQLLRKVR